MANRTQRSRSPFALLCLLLLFSAVSALMAETPRFDARSATDQYLARVPAADKARSDAYFEGGYWLILWDFVYGAAVFLAMLETRLSARMRTLAERFSRHSPVQTFVYWLQFEFAFAVLTFPLTAYEGFLRERQYGLMNQTFAQWLGDQGKELLLALVFGGLAVVALVGVVRRLPQTWHIWGAVVTVVFIVVLALTGPVFIFPLFNRYTPLNDPKVKQPILRLARASGIQVTDVYQVDASRQSNRISANVSGFWGTERITLNDNLLKRCTPEEVMAVMGHEMGHYVLNHVYKFILFALVTATAAFACLRWMLNRSLARWSARWQIRSATDVAALPLAALLLLLLGFLFTPIGNTYVRVQEYEADIFGLNAARLPDAEAEVALKLAEYRKLDPGRLEEWIFYDHPSGRTRIYSAMRWKAEQR